MHRESHAHHGQRAEKRACFLLINALSAATFLQISSFERETVAKLGTISFVDADRFAKVFQRLWKFVLNTIRVL